MTAGAPTAFGPAPGDASPAGAGDVLAVLEARARRLARPPAPPPAGTPHLIATVGAATTVAVPVTRARAIAEPGVPARLPGPIGSHLGLTAVNGALVPVADLARLLGVDPAPAGRGGQLLVVDDGGSPLALRVSQVQRITAIDASDAASFRPPRPPGPAPTGDQLIAGIGPGGVLVLDVDALLADPRLTPQPGGATPPPAADPPGGPLP